MQGKGFQDVPVQRLPAHIVFLAPDLLLLILKGVPALPQLIVLPVINTPSPSAMSLAKLWLDCCESFS